LLHRDTLFECERRKRERERERERRERGEEKREGTEETLTHSQQKYIQKPLFLPLKQQTSYSL